MKKILFVCSANIFRSVSAEYCLKKYLLDNKIDGYSVSSSGIYALPENINPSILEELEKFRIDASMHKQRKLNAKMLKENDLIVCMAQNHVDFIKDNFNKESVLFDSICYGKDDSVLDIDSLENLQKDENEVNNFISKTVNYIHASIPSFMKNINKFIK